MENNLNLFQRLSKVTEAIGTVPKNLNVGFGRNAYKAVAEKDVLAKVKDAEQKYGVYSFPVGRKIISEEAVTNEDGKLSRFVRVESTYRFVNVDNPTEFVDVVGYGDGVDSLDKAPGKALTYADKYCLMKGYKIETGDELDAEASDNLDAHDVLKVKSRVEMAITNYLSRGGDMNNLYAALKLNEKQFNSIMEWYSKLHNFERSLKDACR